ncbi:DENN domain-containing protein 3-like isoform X2 [Actinia tenebrosa]|uniref:DENN domain-containing protein 3-like isoform X2 n=1 Tax=Actinia tenebrosa TaxID=6105 RepID=A0A6P8HBC1_ACTTE|nr:DENN domain-containing protein 3-like isoform X2 [Actinia tenebrosa]
MDNPIQPTKLYNSLIEMCIVVGMDQDTGLSPSSNMKKRKVKVNSSASSLYSTDFKAFVLGALSGQTAMFPNTESNIDGGPFYQVGAVVATPPVKKKKIKTRHSMSVLPGGGVMFPVSSQVFNSLPPLCLPEGGFVYEQPKDETVHHLVLTDIDGNRTYSCCLSIYKPYMAKENENVPGSYDLVYMDPSCDENAIKDSEYVKCYVPLCCCLISKYPYFNIFKDCLSSVVKDLKMDSLSCRTSLMQFISQLAMVPTPPPGSLGIEFNLNGVSNFLKPAVEPELRIVDLDLRYPFLCFSVDDVLLLISCVLTQKRLVFVSSKYSLLTLIIESIFTFIQPFSWSWTYVPVLPNNLIDLVEAPGVYILGCHICLKNQIERVMTTHEMGDIIIVNIDEGTIQKGENVTVHSIPSNIASHFKDWMKKATLQFDLMTANRPSISNMSEYKVARNAFEREFQSIVLTATLEMMARMFSDMTTHQGKLYFDLDGFIASKLDEDRPFYEEVCDSHAFGSFLEDRLRHPDRRDYFSAMIERVQPQTNRQDLRKRSSSLMASSTTQQTPSTPNDQCVDSQSMSVLSLPPFTLEGLFTGSFYDDCLNDLTEKMKNLENSSSLLLGNYLYLRGMFNIARGNRIQGLEDFFAVSSRNVQLFPSSLVENVLSELTKEEEAILQTKSFFGRARQIKYKKKEVENSRRDRKQVVTSAVPTSPLDKEMFKKRVGMLEIATSSATAEKLFEVLTLYRQVDVVDPDVFSHFYEALSETDREAQGLNLNGVTLESGESFVMISPLIRTDRAMGRLIVTNKRLVFMEDGTHQCETVMWFEDVQSVENYQHYVVLPPGVASLKITSKNKCTPPFIACLKEDRNFWYECVKELIAGWKISAETKDTLPIKQASQNVMIAEALRKSDNPDLGTSHVLFLWKTPITSPLSDKTKKMLVWRIDPNPQANESETSTVEAMVYVPTGGGCGEVWCGLGSGAVVVIETKTWSFVSLLQHAKDRVSCLVPVGNDHIWVGSMDTTIYIINRLTKQADQQLHGHPDYISHMVTTQDDDGTVTVWSASLEGLIIGWDPVTLTAKKTIKLNKVKTLTSLISIGDTFWCVTRGAVLIVDRNSDGSDYKSLTASSDQGTVQSIDCMCYVSETNQVWTGIDKKGLIAVWDTNTHSHVIHTVESQGFTQMIHLCGGKVWAGGRDGIVHIFNAKNCHLEESLELHEDRIRSMCLTETAFMLTGPGSRDGRIAVWQTHLTKERTINEPDYEVVEQEIVKDDSNKSKRCFRKKKAK